MLCELAVPGVPADPLEVAARLAHAPGVSVLYDATGGGASFVACRPTAVSHELDPEPSLSRAALACSVPRWIGAIPYESRREIERTRPIALDRRKPPLLERPVWQRYPALVRVAEDVRVVGDDARAARELASELHSAVAPAPEPAWLELEDEPEPEQHHVERIRAALELIRAGQLYQVNLARRFVLRVHGSRLGLLSLLSRRAPSRFAAWLELGEVGVVSSSPEQFLELGHDGRLLTSPIKGTRPRLGDAAADAGSMRDLDADPKERAELTMILDVERNDLGRVCRTGTIRLLAPPAVQTFGPVHHRLATLAGELRPGVSRSELLSAMCPSGSVTGAPKIRAMDAIAELEPERRGLYTGCYGALMHDGGLSLAMAIRCLTLSGDRAHYFSGGGIVADSDPEREVLETRWKARQLGAL